MNFLLNFSKNHNALTSSNSFAFMTKFTKNTANYDFKNSRSLKFAKILDLQKKFREANKITDESLNSNNTNVKQEIEISVLMTKNDYLSESNFTESPVLCMSCKKEGTKESPIYVILKFVLHFLESKFIRFTFGI